MSTAVVVILILIVCCCLCCSSSSSFTVYATQSSQSSADSPTPGAPSPGLGSLISSVLKTVPTLAPAPAFKFAEASSLNDVAVPKDVNAPLTAPLAMVLKAADAPSMFTANQLAALAASHSTPPPPPGPASAYTGDTWTSSSTTPIQIGDTLQTQDKSYSAKVVASGDFQVFNSSGGIVWSAYTNEPSKARNFGLTNWAPTGITFKPDDNFIIHGQWAYGTRDGWSTGASGEGDTAGPFRLVLQSNGRVYMYNKDNAVVWQTK